MRRLLCSLVCVGWLLVTAAATPAWGAPHKSTQGYRFPALQVRYTQYKKRWRVFIRTFHFTKIVGKRPFVLLYFLPGHGPSELELKALDAFQKQWKGKIDCLAVAPIRRYRDIKKVIKRLKALRVDLPVLLDERKQLSYLTLTRRMPSYAAVSRAGYLRLTNAASMTELVAPGLTTAAFLARLNTRKAVPLTRAPGFSPNPYAWVGKKIKPWKGRSLLDASSKSLARLRKGTKQKAGLPTLPMLLVFWSIGCDHCRRLVRQVNEYATRYPGKLLVASFVQSDSAQVLAQIKRFARKHKLVFPLLGAPKGKLFDHYHALTLPTMLLLDAKGVIRAARIGAKGHTPHRIGRMLSMLSKGTTTP